MACCLRAPSHYLYQCWLIITKVPWCSSEGNFTWKISQTLVTKISLKIVFLRFYWNLPRANELSIPSCCRNTWLNPSSQESWLEYDFVCRNIYYIFYVKVFTNARWQVRQWATVAQIWGYVLHIEHISCVITNCGRYQWVTPSLSIALQTLVEENIARKLLSISLDLFLKVLLFHVAFLKLFSIATFYSYFHPIVLLLQYVALFPSRELVKGYCYCKWM